ncbi:MAG: glycoside hydrolase family 5 protein [Treponemataceae bacterium]|nr:glycoside hydrolase family 5 protein [Treponemataceae bacterium]
MNHTTTYLTCLMGLFACMIFLPGCQTGESAHKVEEAVQDDILLGPEYFTTTHPLDPAKTLGRGINMGNYLEAAGKEGAWTGGILIQQEDFQIIRNAGFTNVRIPVRWSDHTAPIAPYKVEEAFTNRVQQVVDWALAAGLTVVINVHHYEEMMKEGKSRLPYHRERLKAIWRQICEIFPLSRYPRERLVFELLNEPNGTVGVEEWNQIITELTELIWNRADQKERKIIVGTANWGGIYGLEGLRLPPACNRDNTIITIHFYEPFQFTHQGAEWAEGAQQWIGRRWRGNSQDRQELLKLFAMVEKWNNVPGRGFEIYMGEFGVYGKYARPTDRRAWTAFVAREAEKRGISWAYWEYSQGFGAYDLSKKSWRRELIEALIPEKAWGSTEKK